MATFTDDIIKEISPYLTDFLVMRLATTCKMMELMLKRSLTSVVVTNKSISTFKDYTGLKNMRKLGFLRDEKIDEADFPPNLSSLEAKTPIDGEGNLYLPASMTKYEEFLTFGEKKPLLKYPKTIVDLKIGGEYIEMIKSLPFIERLSTTYGDGETDVFYPSTLTHLTIRSVSVMSVAAWDGLPRGLVVLNLIFAGHARLDENAKLKNLPPGLKHLMLFAGDLTQHSDDSVNPGLESFRIESSGATIEMDGRILPSSLCKFRALGVKLLNFSSIPKSVTNLGFEVEPCESTPDLHSGLKTLHIRAGYGYGISNPLPAGLTALSFDTLERFFTAKMIKFLPITLTKIEQIGLYDEPIDFSSLVNLKTLYGNSQPMNKYVFPPSLTELGMMVSDITTLPPALEKLTVGVVDTKIGHLPNNIAINIKNIPPSVTFLSMNEIKIDSSEVKTTLPSVKRLSMWQSPWISREMKRGDDVIAKIFPNLCEADGYASLSVKHTLDGDIATYGKEKSGSRYL